MALQTICLLSNMRIHFLMAPFAIEKERIFFLMKRISQLSRKGRNFVMALTKMYLKQRKSFNAKPFFIFNPFCNAMPVQFSSVHNTYPHAFNFSWDYCKIFTVVIMQKICDDRIRNLLPNSSVNPSLYTILDPGQCIIVILDSNILRIISTSYK